MIEYTITEVVLFAWAIIATGYAFRYSDEVTSLKAMLKMIAYDPEMRDRFVKHFATNNGERA